MEPRQEGQSIGDFVRARAELIAIEAMHWMQAPDLQLTLRTFHPEGRSKRPNCKRMSSALLSGNFLSFLACLGNAMAIACLRLFTLPPLPPRPLLARPRL